MKPEQFQQQHQKLVEEAIKAGVPAHVIITCLTMAQIQVGYLHCFQMQQQQFQAMAAKMTETIPAMLAKEQKPSAN